MIGIFDSGIGGLTILKEILKELPQYDYMYLGDNARTPYGNRSHDAVKKFTEEGVNYLFKKGCSLIIIACNTASSNVLRELQEEYLRKPKVTDKKILGVIRPLVEAVNDSQKDGSVGVVGTSGTINSNSYEIELKKLNPKIIVHGKACPLLVPLIEEGWSEKSETKMILRKYLRNLKSKNIGTLILGCTHYPVLYKEFVKYIGKNVHVPHPGGIVANSLKDYLKRHPEIETKLSKNKKRQFLTTDDPDRFKEVSKRFWGTPLEDVKKIQIS